MKTSSIRILSDRLRGMIGEKGFRCHTRRSSRMSFVHRQRFGRSSMKKRSSQVVTFSLHYLCRDSERWTWELLDRSVRDPSTTESCHILFFSRWSIEELKKKMTFFDLDFDRLIVHWSMCFSMTEIDEVQWISSQENMTYTQTIE